MQIQAECLIETVARLQRRIAERIPDAGLLQIASELQRITLQSAERAREIRRSNVFLQILSYALALGLVALLAMTLTQGTLRRPSDLWAMLQGLEAGMSGLVLVGGAIFFVVTLERRLKRRRALAAIQELRVVAHIVDMHQLTKDPDRVFHAEQATENSPAVKLTPFQLGRYLDYCTEMLSLIGKVCVLYGQDSDDDVVLDAVDDIEDLTTGLAQKIWQKIMILNLMAGGMRPSGADHEEHRAPSLSR
jgi:hypothetical protein